jgi:TRAP transporter TAXI family solute receptor
MFEGEQLPIRGLLASYTELVQIVAAADAGINSVADLAGKNVSVGAPGSGTEVNARQVLDAAGLSFDDLGQVFNLSFAESAAHFQDRQIDAFFVTGGVPNASIQEAALSRPVKILPVDGEVLSAIEEKYPFLVSDTIPANTYQGQTEDVTTVGVVAIIAVSEEMDDALAYNLAKVILENRDQIAQAHDKGSSIQPEQITRGITVPLHPGAEQYYKDAGILN